MEVVVGLSLRNLKPRVWDPASPYYLPQVRAVMVSYADFAQQPARRRKAMQAGLHAYLGVPEGVRVYLDNGSFAFHRRSEDVDREGYLTFVEEAQPDWYPPPRDYIPAPAMSVQKQTAQRMKTMAENTAYSYDGFVPVVHVGRYLDRYINDLLQDPALSAKSHVAIGGIVPNLLRAPKALPYRAILDALHAARRVLDDKALHLFGVGGTATLHLAVLLGMDSVDSSGWRNRAARGIVQLPGRGDRLITQLGSWRGRVPDEEEWAMLEACPCPACAQFGLAGLQERGLAGFCKRATHNLWTLLEEAAAIEKHLKEGPATYEAWYKGHVRNSTYEPLIAYTLALRQAHSTGR
ncbi:MAG: hypothetical protein AAFX41_00320 [Bacteroidota bacterium]